MVVSHMTPSPLSYASNRAESVDRFVGSAAVGASVALHFNALETLSCGVSNKVKIGHSNAVAGRQYLLDTEARSTLTPASNASGSLYWWLLSSSSTHYIYPACPVGMASFFARPTQRSNSTTTGGSNFTFYIIQQTFLHQYFSSTLTQHQPQCLSSVTSSALATTRRQPRPRRPNSPKSPSPRSPTVTFPPMQPATL